MNRLATVVSFVLVLALGQAVLAADSGPYGKLAWRSIGPAVSGGRIASVAGIASNPKLYYIGAAGGGVWKTSNGGATWEPVFEKQAVSAIGAVSIDPLDENVVWVGTGESNPRNDVSYGDGVYKTTDGGKTWKNMGLAQTRHISRIAIDPKNPNHVVVAAQGDVFKNSTERGVYVTTDGGATWQKTLYVGPQSGASDLVMASQDPNIVYAGIWQFQRVPWTFTSGGTEDGLYKSIDGGMTWNRLSGHGLPEGVTGRIGLAIAPSDSKRVYAIIESKDGILWRTDDGGATWALVSKDSLVDQRPFYFSHINVDPKNPDHVYAVSEFLAESKDGGKKFKETATNVHVDYHAMWIAPNDPDRMMTGEDGGYALTLDGGKSWAFSRNIPIGQIYHVGLSNENPYWICAPLQDNNGFCGPSNSLDREGIKDEHWVRVVGGDGMWAVPDPRDPNIIITDLQTGRISAFNKVTKQARQVAPYFDFDRNNFNLYKRKYRFNWDSPIAFAPWDGSVLWMGGNVVFQSVDRGEHWRKISPDLTLNLRAHQLPSGGPLALDVSSAENSDTILDIEGSPVKNNQIWVGTDDGIVALTRDGGGHWMKSQLPGVPPFARIETVAPSPFDAATAYAIADRHRSGDYAPYLYVTHNFGGTWTKQTGGLPDNQYVRTVRPDPRNRKLLYAGTENGLWISYDGGATWKDFKLNLPTVSVRDIHIQPQFNDLAIATHGRALWILDDIRPLQDLPQAQARGTMLFPIRPAYQYAYHSEDEGLYTRFSGKNPPGGAIINFYLAKPLSSAAEVQILDSSGHIIRHIVNRKPEGDETEPVVPAVTNVAGINRVTWDFREDGGPRWMGAAKADYRGPLVGAAVLPGNYSARIVLDGHTYTQPFVVMPNPKVPYLPAEARAGYAFTKKYLRVGGQINVVLSNLDAQKKSLEAASSALTSTGNTALAAKVADALKARERIFNEFTANYHNDEDSIQYPGQLREDVPAGGFGSQAAPTAAVLEFTHRFDLEYAAVMKQYNDYIAETLVPLSSELQAAGQKPIDGTVSVSK